MSLLYKTRVAMWFPAKITSSCTWVAILVDWLFYIGMPVARTDGRSFGRSVHGHVITKFSARMTRTARAVRLDFFAVPSFFEAVNKRRQFKVFFLSKLWLNSFKIVAISLPSRRNCTTHIRTEAKIIILHETKADQTIAHYTYTEISFWFRS